MPDVEILDWFARDRVAGKRLHHYLHRQSWNDLALSPRFGQPW